MGLPGLSLDPGDPRVTSDAHSIKLSARKNSKSLRDFEFFRVRCSGSWSPVPPGGGPWEAWEGLGGPETRFSSLKTYGFKSSQGLWNPRKSTLQNPMNKTPGPGRAKNDGF